MRRIWTVTSHCLNFQGTTWVAAAPWAAPLGSAWLSSARLPAPHGVTRRAASLAGGCGTGTRARAAWRRLPCVPAQCQGKGRLLCAPAPGSGLLDGGFQEWEPPAPLAVDTGVLVLAEALVPHDDSTGLMIPRRNATAFPRVFLWG